MFGVGCAELVWQVTFGWLYGVVGSGKSVARCVQCRAFTTTMVGDHLVNKGEKSPCQCMHVWLSPGEKRCITQQLLLLAYTLAHPAAAKYGRARQALPVQHCCGIRCHITFDPCPASLAARGVFRGRWSLCSGERQAGCRPALRQRSRCCNACRPTSAAPGSVTQGERGLAACGPHGGSRLATAATAAARSGTCMILCQGHAPLG